LILFLNTIIAPKLFIQMLCYKDNRRIKPVILVLHKGEYGDIKCNSVTDPVWMFLAKSTRNIKERTMEIGQTLYIRGADTSDSGTLRCYGTSLSNKPFWSVGTIKVLGKGNKCVY